MRQVYSERPAPQAWRVPAGVLERRVDTYTGLVLQDGCYPSGSGESTEIFLAQHVPASTCPQRDFWSDFWGRVGGYSAAAEATSGEAMTRSTAGRERVLGGRDIRVESERSA
jgi:hypothetical protein